MQETLKIAIGVAIILLGIPIGTFLAQKTKEELKVGQRWFRLIIAISLVCSIVALIIQNDFLFFSFLFIALVTSRSLTSKNK